MVFMGEIKVFLRQGSHPLYSQLVRYPPRGVQFQKSSLTTAGDKGLVKNFKRFVWDQATKFRPPIFHVNSGDTNLIHSAYGSLVSNEKNWVVDVEHGASFAKYHVKSLENENYRRKIIELLASPFCKKIMPWTHAAARSVSGYFENPSIVRKIKVVYPALKPRNIPIKKDDGIFRILVTNRFFYEKGGKQALDAFAILSKKCDVRMDVLAPVPQEIKRQYSQIKNLNFVDKIFVNEPGGVEEMFREYYSKAHMMLHLTFGDTFGYVLLEAMSMEIPIIGSDMFSMPEIVEDEKNGFIVELPFQPLEDRWKIKYHKEFGNFNILMDRIKNDRSNFAEMVAKKAEELINDSSLRKQMGRNGRKMIEKGKFSIPYRNRKLLNVYKESIE